MWLPWCHIAKKGFISLFYLKKSQYLDTDPWILSSYISLLLQSYKPTDELIKRGVKLSESKEFSAFDLNELRSTLGTFQLFNGTEKKATALINQSLVSPNGREI